MRGPETRAAGGEGWEFAAGTLLERTVERAHVLMEVREEGGVALVVLDAAGGEFVRLPPPPPGLEPIALAADGRSILLGRGGTLVRTYFDGGVQEFAGGFPCWTGALSPDGRYLAALGVDGGTATVCLLGTAAGERRDLWRARGNRSVESRLSWSPDGRLLACTYLTENVTWEDDDEIATVVLDTCDGTVVARRDHCGIFLPGASWAGPRELLYHHEWADDDLLLLSLDDGAEQPLRTGYGGALGVHGRRLIVPSDESPGADGRAEIFTTTLTGQDRRPFVRAHRSPGSLPPRLIDIASGLALR